MARIVALFGARRGLALDFDRRLLVGRSAEADIQLLDEKVSREHCALELSEGRFVVKDLGSRNGTSLNGEPVPGPTPLKPGDQIGVGETVFIFEPDFEALRARDGESTMVLTASAASGARSASPMEGRALEKAGETALRAALAPNPKEAAALLAQALFAALEPSALTIALLGPGGTLRPLLGRPVGTHLLVGRALVDLALRQGKPMAMPEAQAYAETDSRTTRVRSQEGEVLCAPFHAMGSPAGAVCLARRRPFDDGEIALAGALAAAAGPALVEPIVVPSVGRATFEQPVAESAAMRDALRLATAAAQVASTVLVRGETGTGKEEIARAIHALGPRGKGPFVPINCGAIPADLAESELFGHEKGSFTGAVASRAGAFEQADGGTLVLDEIGELSPPLQVKLLRVLQERMVQRVGGRGATAVDVRVVAATHRDLAAMVKAGTFREDLFWRLNVLSIELPPLRERREDILPLAERFLTRLSRELGRRADGFSREARDALRACSWPGNARQLANVIERALVLKTDDEPIALQDLPCEVIAPTKDAPETTGRTLADLIRTLEREQVFLALKRCRGVKSAAAEALGISRPTLDRKIEEYKIDLFE